MSSETLPDSNYPRSSDLPPQVSRNLSPIVTWGVAIMAVLVFAAIAFPLLATGGGGSKKVGCISNLKRIAMDSLMYAGDANDVLPSSRVWIDQTSPYTKNPDVYRCTEVSPGGYGYAMNDWASQRPLASIHSPARKVLLFETDDLQRNAHGMPSRTSQFSRHKGWAAQGFTDGHVKSKRPQLDPMP